MAVTSLSWGDFGKAVEVSTDPEHKPPLTDTDFAQSEV